MVLAVSLWGGQHWSGSLSPCCRVGASSTTRGSLLWNGACASALHRLGMGHDSSGRQFFSSWQDIPSTAAGKNEQATKARHHHSCHFWSTFASPASDRISSEIMGTPPPPHIRRDKVGPESGEFLVLMAKIRNVRKIRVWIFLFCPGGIFELFSIGFLLFSNYCFSWSKMHFSKRFLKRKWFLKLRPSSQIQDPSKKTIF